MTNDNNTRTKANAVFFAAVMVISMVAVGFAAAPAAAANTADGTEYDFDLNDNELAFQGQVVYSDNATDNESVTLRSGAPDDENSFIRQNSANSQGEVTFETEGLESDDYYITNSSGVIGEFEIAVQSFDGEFDPTEVDNGGTNTNTTHEVDTNRGSEFNVTVSAEYDGDTVGNETLADIIVGSDDDVVDDEESVRVTGVEDTGELVANFDGQDAGAYDITVDVEDTTAEATQTINVSDVGDGEIDFENSFVTVDQGDVAEVTLTFEGDTDDAYLRIGDAEDVGYSANVSVEADGADSVTVGVNTYATGTPGEIFTIESTHDDDPDPSLTFEGDSGNLDNILATGQYPMELDRNGVDDINNDNADTIGDLEIQERSVGEFNVWTTSDEVFEDIEDAEDVAGAAENGTLVQQSDIATDGTDGDVIVHELQATGLEGIIANSSEGTLLDTLTLNDSADDEGLTLRVQQSEDSTAPNTAPKTANITAMADDIDVISGDGVYYIAFDTEDVVLDDDDVELDDSFDVRTQIEDRRLLDPEDEDDNDFDIEDAYESVTTSFTVVEATGEFDTPVDVSNGEEETISGTTNLAPGNTLSVRATSADGVTPGFVVSESDLEVQPDGTFSADELDFSDASVGNNFTVSTRTDGLGESLEADGTVVESVDDGDDAEATFEVSGLEPAEATATAGDSVTVSATIENTGGAEGTQTVALTLDGDELDTTEVTLAGGDSQTVEFTADTSGLDAGDYTHGIATDDGEATGTLTIEAAGGDDGGDGTDDGGDGTDDGGDGTDDGGDGTDNGTDGGEETEDGTPGFGALVALVALIAAALLATRRND